MDRSASCQGRHQNLEPNLRTGSGLSEAPHVGVTYSQVVLLFHVVWPHIRYQHHKILKLLPALL